MFVTDKRHSVNRKTLGDESIVSSMSNEFDDMTISRQPTIIIRDNFCQEHSPRSTLLPS